MVKTKSPLEQLKVGIEAGDWKPVVGAYFKLSGEKLAAPKAAAGKTKTRTVTVTVPQEITSADDVPPHIAAQIRARAFASARATAVKLLNVLGGTEAGNLHDLARRVVGALSIDEDQLLLGAGSEAAEPKSPAPAPPKAVDIDQFRVTPPEPSRAREGGGTYARPVDLQAGEAVVNRFESEFQLKDALRGVSAFDKAVSANFTPQPRVRVSETRMVDVTCKVCKQDFKEDQRTLGGETYTCPGCIKRAFSGRT